MIRLPALAIVAATATFTDASAEWVAEVVGPDVFGNTKVVASTSGFNDGLVFQCDQKDQLHIAFLFRKKKFDNVPTKPAELLLQFESGEPVKLVASLRTWNDDFGGVVASGRTAELVSVLRSIGTAKGKINMGAVIGGNQVSASFGSQGSKLAVEKAVKACKLEDLEKKS